MALFTTYLAMTQESVSRLLSGNCCPTYLVRGGSRVPVLGWGSSDVHAASRSADVYLGSAHMMYTISDVQPEALVEAEFNDCGMLSQHEPHCLWHLLQASTLRCEIQTSSGMANPSKILAMLRPGIQHGNR